MAITTESIYDFWLLECDEELGDGWDCDFYHYTNCSLFSAVRTEKALIV